MMMVTIVNEQESDAFCRDNVTHLTLPVPSVECSTLTAFLKELNSIPEVTQCLSAKLSSFEYKDEEGDRLLVQNEEDFKCMLDEFMEIAGPTDEPSLFIYPICSAECNGRDGDPHLCVSTAEDENMGNGALTSSDSSVSPVDQFSRILQGSNVDPAYLSNLGVLGSGHCGTVYKTLDTRYDRVVAVKCISLDLLPSVQNMILSELQILMKCSSPYIIGFYGAFFADSRFSFVTELVDGGSVGQYGQVPELVLCVIARSVLRGLLYLWHMKIMHRDIKPSNILVSTCGHVKLCDFGVSIQLQQSIAKSYVGTNAYMSPERILGAEYRNSSDVWSVGISLLELRIGRLPFDGCTELALMTKIVEQNPFLSSYEAYFTVPELKMLIKNCLKKTPKERPTPAQLQQHDIYCGDDTSDCYIVSTWIKSAQNDDNQS